MEEEDGDGTVAREEDGYRGEATKIFFYNICRSSLSHTHTLIVPHDGRRRVVHLVQILHFSGPNAPTPRIDGRAPMARIDGHTRVVACVRVVTELMASVAQRILRPVVHPERIAVFAIKVAAVFVEVEEPRHHVGIGELGRVQPVGRGPLFFVGGVESTMGQQIEGVGKTAAGSVRDDDGNQRGLVVAFVRIVPFDGVVRLLREELGAVAAHVPLAENVARNDDVFGVRHQRFGIKREVAVVQFADNLS